MESTSGRSSVASKRHRSMVEVRTTPLSRISRPGSALDTILDRMGAIHADTRNAIEAIHADIGAVHADTRSSIEAIHADIGVHPNIDPVQAETREVLETVMHKLEHLETSPVPKFAAGLDLNPSHSGEMTAASYHSTIESEVVMGPGVLRRSERLLNKPKVDYRQVALQPMWLVSTAVSSDSGQIPILNPSSSSVALHQHANPSAFEMVPATLVERGRNVTVATNIQRK